MEIFSQRKQSLDSRDLRAGWKDSLPVIERDNDNGFRNRLVHSCRTFSQGFHPLCSPGEVRPVAGNERWSKRRCDHRRGLTVTRSRFVPIAFRELFHSTATKVHRVRGVAWPGVASAERPRTRESEFRHSSHRRGEFTSERCTVKRTARSKRR